MAAERAQRFGEIIGSKYSGKNLVPLLESDRMVKSAINWLSWSSVALTVFFIFFAFAAIKNWFDQETADMLTRWTAALIFLLGAALLCCIMIDYGEQEDEDG